MAYESTAQSHKDRYTLANLTTEHAMAIVILICLVLLILIAHGFRGVTVGGLTAKIS